MLWSGIRLTRMTNRRLSDARAVRCSVWALRLDRSADGGTASRREWSVHRLVHQDALFRHAVRRHEPRVRRTRRRLSPCAAKPFPIRLRGSFVDWGTIPLQTTIGSLEWSADCLSDLPTTNAPRPAGSRLARRGGGVGAQPRNRPGVHPTRRLRRRPPRGRGGFL